MPCDRDFGIIEKEKRKLQYLFLPDERTDLIKRFRNFKVYRMKQDDFFTAFLEKRAFQKRDVKRRKGGFLKCQDPALEPAKNLRCTTAM